MMLLRANEEYSPFFIMHWLNSPYVTNYIRTITGGSASPHVNGGDIKSQRIPKINLEEQNNAVKKIESRLSVCDSIEKNRYSFTGSRGSQTEYIKTGFRGRVINMNEVFFPYYINKGRLLDIYAILNRGYSEYEELSLSSNDEVKKIGKGEVSIEGGFKLFKLGGKAADEKTNTNSEELTRSIKKVQTIPSILKIVLEELSEKKYIKSIEESNTGDFVVIDNVSFQINSIKLMMEEIDELLKLIGELKAYKTSQDKKHAQDFKNISKSIKVICNGEEVLYKNDKYAIFGNIFEECLYQSIKTDLINSEFKCLCQIKRKYETGTSLMKNTMLSKIKDKDIKNNFIKAVSEFSKNDAIDFNSIAVAEITDKPVYEIEIIALYK